MVCSLIILALTHSAVMLLLAGLFNGLAFGTLLPSMQAWMFSSVEPKKSRLASATYFNFYDIGMGVGAVLLGSLIGIIGYSLMFAAAAMFVLVFLAVYLVYMVKQKKRLKNPQ